MMPDPWPETVISLFDKTSSVEDETEIPPVNGEPARVEFSTRPFVMLTKAISVPHGGQVRVSFALRVTPRTTKFDLVFRISIRFT